MMGVVAVVLLVACSSGGSSSPKHALGTEVAVDYQSSPTASSPAATTKLGVTVLKVRTGTQDDLSSAGFQVEDKDKDTTPTYVDVRYANEGDAAVPRQLSVGLEDTGGNSLPTVLVTSLSDEPFSLCNDTSTNDPLAPGDSYESCTLFLVPKGTKVDRVRFVSQGADNKITFTDWATS